MLFRKAGNGEYRAINREDLGAVFPFRAKSLQNSPQILSQLGQLYKHELILVYAGFFGKREIREKRRISKIKDLTLCLTIIS